MSNNITIFLWNIIDPWLIEPVAAEPVDIVGQLYMHFLT